MAKISVDRKNLDRLLADSGHRRGTTYQQTFEHLARTHLGRPVEEIVALLQGAADEARLGFHYKDLYEQAEAIHAGRRYVLKVTVT
ncbi:hypothetical protein ACWGQL_30145 [Streptomyces lydicus]|uniref:hypothetical protein n=1 Tax=Streptomyces lydicus TaxID=47763 RepID=UPI0037CE4383